MLLQYIIEGLGHFLLKLVTTVLFSLDFNGDCITNVRARQNIRKTSPSIVSGNSNFNI